MSMIKKLRKISNEIHNEAKAKKESENKSFLNGDLFKTILADFEKDALNAAKLGYDIAFIHNLEKYFGTDYDLGYCHQILVYAMGKSGYRYSPSSYAGFTWIEENV